MTDLLPHRGSCRTLATAWLLAAALTAHEAAAQTPGRVTRASVDSLGGEATGNSGAPALSADGRFVAFASDAPDLVPGDTNDDSDVFVRDRQTGVVDRVSLAWNGNEARDDSACPAVSSDGRFVAFLSRAWNLYPGGANLGRPRWDVYLRDRQAGTTTRLSVSKDGGDPDADSSCPSISGDGRRVVFDSVSANLVSGDGNSVSDVFLWDAVKNKLKRVSRAAAAGGDADAESWDPAISRDGRFVVFTSRATNLRESGVPQPPLTRWATTVFVRDLDAGITEAASLKDDASTGWPYSPQEDSFLGSVSDDGRYVGFSSTAWNLVVPTPARRNNVYVRDRATGRTILASPTAPQTDCGRPGDHFLCASSFPLVSGQISGDGRFVVFSSRSRELLPANLYHGDQVYLFDVEGRRLRRLSVDETGWESDSCSVDPVLSADARVLAYRSTSTNLVAGDTNQRADVFVHEWTCDQQGRCRTLAACPAEPQPCAGAVASLVRLDKRPPGGSHADRFFWSWTGTAGAPSFPDPTKHGRYQLCVYGRALALDVAMPAAQACGDGDARPCWRRVASGHRLVDPDGAVTTLRVTTESGRPRLLLRGGGALLDGPYLPIAAPDGLVVQLQETGSGRCWGAAFAAQTIKRNIAGTTARGSRRDGHLVAQLR